MLAHTAKEVHLYAREHAGMNVQRNKGKGINTHIRLHIRMHIHTLMHRDVNARNSS